MNIEYIGTGKVVIKPVPTIKIAKTNLYSKEFKRTYHPDGKNINFTENVIEDILMKQKLCYQPNNIKHIILQRMLQNI